MITMSLSRTAGGVAGAEIGGSGLGAQQRGLRREQVTLCQQILIWYKFLQLFTLLKVKERRTPEHVLTNCYDKTVLSCVQLPEWRERESAILALGAISEGCAAGMQPYIGSMVEMLLPKVSDHRPLVRSITCWALSRYSGWVVRALGDAEGKGKVQFDAVLQVRNLIRPCFSFIFLPCSLVFLGAVMLQRLGV
jgi:hypothetical protein